MFASKTLEFCDTTLSAEDLGNLYDNFDLDLSGTLNPSELEIMLNAVTNQLFWVETAP